MLVIYAPHFALTLDTRRGLRAMSLTNRLSNRVLSLGGGAEFELDLDAARERLWIEGWRTTTLEQSTIKSHREDGFRLGFHRPEFDDAKWNALPTPNMMGWRSAPNTWFWARTHLFLPAECHGRPLLLLLGGFGISDFRFTRVFVNGRLLGVRRTKTRWFEPGQFDLGARAPIHRHLRFGQDNIIALQLTNPFWRTEQLDERDPHATHCLPLHRMFSHPYVQCVVVGTPAIQPRFVVESVDQDNAAHALVKLRTADSGLRANVKYEVIDDGRVLRKSARLINDSPSPLRLLSVGLGAYHTDVQVSAGEIGFPVYADDEIFCSLDHPAGWAMGERGAVRLRQYPGVMLQAGQSFVCMNTVIGVAEKGRAHEAFRAHLGKRMRRVARKRDHPYAILDFFGAWERESKEQFLSEEPTAKFSQRVVRHLAAFRKQTGEQFDFLSFDFWCDRKGDLTQFKRPNFPQGFVPFKKALQPIGVAPALWLDTGWGLWGIGENPVVQPSRSDNIAYAESAVKGAFALCNATEPFRSLFTNGCLHHLHENGVRLFKFDSFRAVCNNVRHEHLPGLYSTEAICNAMIETFHTLDAECPDLFLMAYWGFSSPWWLLHSDTIFESGLHMEASSPSPTPTLYARDGVNLGLDMAQGYCQDVPWLGKDSLGVWLSDWPWNSMIGKERWQEGFVLDLCRGSLLAQLWSDADLLSRNERQQLATFIALLRARPECFRTARLVLGNPWRGEPYGYCCSDGRRAFVAIHNCCWRDSILPLALGDFCSGGHPRKGGTGRPPLQQRWDIYRWHPDPAQLDGDSRSMILRPFEVVLLEVVPAGESPSLNRAFTTRPLPTAFAEPSRELKPAVSAIRMTKDRRDLSVHLRVPATTRGGTLTITADRNKNGRAFQTHFVGKELELIPTRNGPKFRAMPVLGQHTYPCAWQAWRIRVAASAQRQRFEGRLSAQIPAQAKLTCRAYFIPN